MGSFIKFPLNLPYQVNNINPSVKITISMIFLQRFVVQDNPEFDKISSDLDIFTFTWVNYTDNC